MTAHHRLCRFRSKKKHFLCPLNLRNRLPDPVPGPKLLALPMELQSLVDFKPTSLDSEYKWKHHCERTLGVHIDLVDLDAHTPASVGANRRAALHEDDERLLKWETLGAASKTNSQAAPRRERVFLRKTEFMSNDLSRTSALGNRGAARDPVHNSGAAGSLASADARLAAAIQSFALARESDQAMGGDGAGEGGHAKRKMVHPTKPHLTVEWSLPVLPDAELWANQYRYPRPLNLRSHVRRCARNSLFISVSFNIVAPCPLRAWCQIRGVRRRPERWQASQAPRRGPRRQRQERVQPARAREHPDGQPHPPCWGPWRRGRWSGVRVGEAVRDAARQVKGEGGVAASAPRRRR